MIRPSRLLLPFLLAAAALPCRAQAGWDEFHAVMWQDQSPAGYRALPALGVDGARAFGFRGPVVAERIAQELAPIRAAGLRFYLENLATDFYSSYHRWTDEHPKEVTWLFDQARKRYRANPDDPSVFLRTPSLSDPAWLARIAGRMRDNGRAYAAYRPLFYNLGDEPGIADLAAAWDFDRGADSLKAFRLWLHGRYASLAQLNRQWGTGFTSWDAVTPQTTTQALTRSDGNYAAWAEFRDFMDSAFADALRAGTDGLHEGDPEGLAGIEGTQAPGPGGYDYIRLARAVDVMEMYGAGDSVDIARSFNPELVVLTTDFTQGPGELKRIWHSLVTGARGLIIWDAETSFVDAAGKPSARALELAPVLHELHAGLGAQLIALRPAPGPVAILYSPFSQHLQWLEDRRGEEKPWTERTAETEWQDENRMRRSIATAVRELTHLGLPPHFVSPAMLEGGLLGGPEAPRALVLPQAAALSDTAAAAIRGFVARGGLVLADGMPGIYDGHGSRRAKPNLADLAPNMPAIAAMQPALAAGGIGAGFTLREPDGTAPRDVTVRVLHTGGVRVLAIEQDAAAAGASEGRPREIELVLDAPAAIHDLRGGRSLADARRISVTLDPVTPSLLAVSPAPLGGPTLSGPVGNGGRIAAGAAVHWRLGLTGDDAGARHAVRIRLIGPDGTVVPAYSGVRVLGGADAQADWQVRFAPDAPPGRWRIEATDLLGGGTAEAAFTLEAP
jgi:hypothetical protein